MRLGINLTKQDCQADRGRRADLVHEFVAKGGRIDGRGTSHHLRFPSLAEAQDTKSLHHIEFLSKTLKSTGNSALPAASQQDLRARGRSRERPVRMADERRAVTSLLEPELQPVTAPRISHGRSSGLTILLRFG